MTKTAHAQREFATCTCIAISTVEETLLSDTISVRWDLET